MPGAVGAKNPPPSQAPLESMSSRTFHLPVLIRLPARSGQRLVRGTGSRETVTLRVKSGHGYDGGRLKVWADPDARSRESFVLILGDAELGRTEEAAHAAAHRAL